MAGRSSVTIEPKYRFTGKEMSEATGHYLFGARTYNPLIGKWDQVDPLEEKYLGYSPYNYVKNDPLNSIDPDGKFKKRFDDNKNPYFTRVDMNDCATHLIEMIPYPPLSLLSMSIRGFVVGDPSLGSPSLSDFATGSLGLKGFKGAAELVYNCIDKIKTGKDLGNLLQTVTEVPRALAIDEAIFHVLVNDYKGKIEYDINENGINRHKIVLNSKWVETEFGGNYARAGNFVQGLIIEFWNSIDPALYKKLYKPDESKKEWRRTREIRSLNSPSSLRDHLNFNIKSQDGL